MVACPPTRVPLARTAMRLAKHGHPRSRILRPDRRRNHGHEAGRALPHEGYQPALYLLLIISIVRHSVPPARWHRRLVIAFRATARWAPAFAGATGGSQAPPIAPRVGCGFAMSLRWRGMRGIEAKLHE